jgi:hypothetical protein
MNFYVVELLALNTVEVAGYAGEMGQCMADIMLAKHFSNYHHAASYSRDINLKGYTNRITEYQYDVARLRSH